MPSKNDNITVIGFRFLVIRVFGALLRAHFYPCHAARAKMSSKPFYTHKYKLSLPEKFKMAGELFTM